MRFGIRRRLRAFFGMRESPRIVLERDLATLSLLPSDLPAPDPRLYGGFPAPAAGPVIVKPGAERIVVLHLHYPDLWPEFAAALQNMPSPWGLIATVTCPDLLGPIKSAFPGSVVLPIENRGRDMGPFFEVLSAGFLDGARAVCKLHGKKSIDNGRPKQIGELWRRSALISLLGSKGRILQICSELDRAGVIGPAHLRFPNSRLPESAAWMGMNEQILDLSRRLGIENLQLDFFGGSMFWISAPVAQALKRLGLRQSDFEPETEYTQVSLAHACERIVIPAAHSVGLPAASVPLNCLEATYSMREKSHLDERTGSAPIANDFR